jgi:hypothetical protein
MSTPNINCILQGILAVTNNLAPNAPQVASIDLQNPTLNGTVFFYEQYLQATTTGVGQGMPGPAGKAFVVLVQNLSTTSELQVTVTPTGGTPTTFTYGPGGVFIHFDPTEDGTGISALTLTGVGGTVPCSVLVAV